MKDELINIAIENVNQQTYIKAEWIAENGLDGLLKLIINKKEYFYNIEVKKELRQYQLAQINELKKQFHNLIIIAEQIYPNVKEQLRKLKIPYLEANGNFFLQNKDYFCLVDTNKKVTLRKEKANRAFTKTGLKIVFHLLINPELINKTQREIAEIAGVGLGNIPQVINGLKETGYLLTLKKGIYVWEKKDDLINRWINGYATELRPRLTKGTFAIKEDWQKIDLNTAKTIWGGEPAADLLTNYLRPEKLLLYTKESNPELIKKYKFIPKNKGEGDLEALDIFWHKKDNETVAPPLLIYAELIITGGKRNIETAQLIYNEYIKPKL
ncbi:type IV toxin-antitoxin system AbiEi family antitoxin [Saccharicrinis sp. FJH54]|uniref:type IV toxin-antitoxin system AbiEi family antitoxin n=1 Tax=Saccharicrinis sp. FJH54 TaxID=3344665 RepID=UPI0035D449B1